MYAARLSVNDNNKKYIHKYFNDCSPGARGSNGKIQPDRFFLIVFIDLQTCITNVINVDINDNYK